VTARQLTLRTKSQIDASTTGTGNGGSVTVNVAGTALLEGIGPDDRTGILAQSIRNDLVDRNGDGGPVTVNAGELVVRNGAVVSSSTFTEGNAAPCASRRGASSSTAPACPTNSPAW
jgi:large exoprotein involved in heme utilization and adhesion